jgi:flavodoxin I
LKQIGIFYGSSTGDTERVAQLIQKTIGTDKVMIHDIIESKAEDLIKYSFLILGISTWGIGKIQDDWEMFLPKIKNIDFTGKKIALFGLGDQESYPDTFADALGILYDIIKSPRCSIIGEWPVEGYEFIHSKAERNGKFAGLVLDERNQPELTEERIISWIRILDLKLSESTTCLK